MSVSRFLVVHGHFNPRVREQSHDGDEGIQAARKPRNEERQRYGQHINQQGKQPFEIATDRPMEEQAESAEFGVCLRFPQQSARREPLSHRADAVVCRASAQKLLESTGVPSVALLSRYQFFWLME